MGNLLSRKAWKRRVKRWVGSTSAAPQTASQEPVKPAVRGKPVNEKLRAARALADGIEFLVPQVPLETVFAGASHAEVVMLLRLIRSHTWSMPEHELMVLGAISRMVQPKRVVEFGTFQGGSSLAIIANAAPDCRLITIDLDPQVRKNHEHGVGVGLPDFDVGCLFRDTRYARQIEQRFANTVEFRDDDLIGKADMVLVDADHTYQFARRDTEKALQFLKPGGTIVWHDYSWEPQHSECAGVTKTVNEFWEKHGHCHHISGTRFAIFQDRARVARAA